MGFLSLKSTNLDVDINQQLSMFKERGKYMAKATKKRPPKIEEDIESAALSAADEALAELNDETSAGAFENDGVGVSASLSDALPLAADVFEEGFKRATERGDSPRYHIKKNSQFLTVKDWPYSWERLQEEYGAGYYQVFAKGRSNGQLLKQQTEMVGDPNDGREKIDDEPTKKDANLAVLAMMQQIQDRAETRAREDAKSGESTIASMMQGIVSASQASMQTIMTIQQQSNQQFQTLMMEMQKQNQMIAQKSNDQMMTLVTTLLTQKPQKDDGGFTTANVLKMIQDAETRAETRAMKQQEMIEKKANELADIKAEAIAGNEETEPGGIAGMVKGFMPVLTQLVANQQSQQPTPEQVAASHIEQARQLNGQVPKTFVEGPQRPAIPAPSHMRQSNPQRPAQTSAPRQVVSQTEPATQVVPPPAAPTVNGRVEEAEKLLKFKNDVFDFCAPDIGQGMLGGVAPAKVWEDLTKKLENHGVTRQTIASAFKLEDFYGYADKYKLPDAAKPWLKDFHEAIQQSVVQKSTGKPKPRVDGAGKGVEKPRAGAQP